MSHFSTLPFRLVYLLRNNPIPYAGFVAATLVLSIFDFTSYAVPAFLSFPPLAVIFAVLWRTVVRWGPWSWGEQMIEGMTMHFNASHTPLRELDADELLVDVPRRTWRTCLELHHSAPYASEVAIEHSCEFIRTYAVET